MDVSEISHLFSLRAIRRGASLPERRDHQWLILSKDRVAFTWKLY